MNTESKSFSLSGNMDQSIQVKIQYFHDALISQYESIEMTLIAGSEMGEEQKKILAEQLLLLRSVIDRHEDLFQCVLYLD